MVLEDDQNKPIECENLVQIGSAVWELMSGTLCSEVGTQHKAWMPFYKSFFPMYGLFPFWFLFPTPVGVRCLLYEKIWNVSHKGTTKVLRKAWLPLISEVRYSFAIYSSAPGLLGPTSQGHPPVPSSFSLPLGLSIYITLCGCQQIMKKFG